MDFTEINHNLTEVRKVLDMKVDHSEPMSLIVKLENISNILGLSAEILAWTEKHYNSKIADLNNIYDKKSPTDRKFIFGEAAKYEIYFNTLAEKYNKEIHYQIDLLRTLISFVKKDFDTLGR